MKKTVLRVALITTAVLVLFTGSVYAQQVISVSPGSSVTKEFYLNGVFDLDSMSPIMGAIVMTLSFADPAGDMTISVTPAASREWGSIFSFMVIGTGITLSADNPLPFIYEKAEIPSAGAVTTTVPINSNFGMLIIGVLIDKVDDTYGSVNFPMRFSATVSVSAGAAAE